jgi:subtilisin family serine protease
MALGPTAIYGYMSLPTSRSELAGGAFLLAPDLAVTCAHVVRDHLGLGSVTPDEAPHGVIKLRFPAIDCERDGNVIPGGWHADPQEGGARPLRDVALIHLAKPVNDPEVLVIPLAVTSPPPGGRGWIVGAGPGWQEHQQEIKVELGYAANARGRWQVTDQRGHGATVAPGFSGSPLFGESMTVIWGMVQQVGDPGERTTLVLGADRLHEALSAAEIAPRASVRGFRSLNVRFVRGGLGDEERADKAVEIAPVDAPKSVRKKPGTPERKVRRAGPQRRNWGLDRLNIEPLWALGLRGEGVRIGDISTGVEASHRLLKGRVSAYARFDHLGTRVPHAQPRDTDGVGTHTAGILVGADKGSSVGVAPNAELYVAEALEGGDLFARVLGSVDWMLENEVRVLNLSFGLREYSPDFETVIAVLRQKDVICVASVGNEGPDTSRSPGNYRDVISVGAIDARDQVAPFSSSQRFNVKSESAFSVPSVVAPGVSIVSAVGKSGMAAFAGTSMASAYVAGLAALLRQAAPQARAVDIRDAIFASSKKPRRQSPVRFGHGVPNGVEAIRHLARKDLIDPGFLKRWSP